jgi:hypothetical protein
MRKVVTAIILSLVIPPFMALAMALPAEDFPAWAHHKDAFINTSPTGAGVDTMLTGFPLLIRLDAAVFPFAEARPNGEDLRFTNAAGAVLHHEIEYWNAAQAQAAVWVRLDTLRGNASDQAIRMHWGHATVPGVSNGPAVFGDLEGDQAGGAAGNASAAGSGFVGVWHLGGSGARPNSTPNGQAAIPNNYLSNASGPGVIGLADSLDGGESGSYLDIGDGYASLSKGFTFSAWVNPDSSGSSVHFLDMGNGGGRDNIALGRYRNTQTLSFVAYNGSAASNIVFGDAILAPGRWQNVAVTVSGLKARLYRNGALIAEETLTQPISNAARSTNYLGRANFGSSDYYKGKIDEPRLSDKALSPAWIKLAYESQRPDQKTVTFAKAPVCVERFSASADTVIAEGMILELYGVADCADHYLWSALEGPAPRILDPEVKSLRILVPRVSRDTLLLFQFSAGYDGNLKSKQVYVTVKETIPEPIFTLPPYLEWDGKKNLVLAPDILNHAALSISSSPRLYYSWSLPESASDTALLDGALMLNSTGNGKANPSLSQMNVGLCLDNGGPSVCHQVLVMMPSASTALGARLLSDGPDARVPPFDLRGRLVPSKASGLRQTRIGIPRFYRP